MFKPRSNTFKIVQNCSKLFPCSQLNVTFRDEMARAATNRGVATKPAAKPKDGTEKGAARPPAKKKTATGGARVALNVPHVAADKPHEEGRAATELDRAVLLPQALVPLPVIGLAPSPQAHGMRMRVSICASPNANDDAQVHAVVRIVAATARA